MKLGDGCTIELAPFIDGRGIFVADSGGGKSHALRRFLEQTYGKVQHLVIDPEGEFSTLREKFDYVIAAPKDADVEASPRTAAKLATSLLELGASSPSTASAILDIYDLKPRERREFVRLFCEALVNAPKHLRHPVLVILDEAHMFCPEGEKSECGHAVIDLATRGRKRGLCLIMATQRLAALNKNAAGQAVNKLIGRTGQDIDVRRAAFEIGMAPKDALAALRNLEPGQFYAFGSGFDLRVPTLIQVGPVQTTHHRSGHRFLEPPPEPSAKIKALLAKGLADLPREAERAARSEEELRAEVTRLRGDLTRAQNAAKAQGVPEAEVARRIAQAVREAKAAAPVVSAMDNKAAGRIRGHLERALAELKEPSPLPVFRVGKTEVLRVEVAPAEGLTRPQQAILDALARLESLGVMQAGRPTVGAFADASARSSAFSNNVSRLNVLQLLRYPSTGLLALTDAGREKANHPATPATQEDFHRAWLGALERPQAAILRVLLDQWPKAVDRESLAVAAGASPASSAYSNNVSRLSSLGAITYPEKGMVRAADLLFPKGAQ